MKGCCALDSPRWPRATTSRESRGADFLDHRLRMLVLQNVGERGVGAMPERIGDVVRIGEAATLGEQPALRRHQVGRRREITLAEIGGERVEQARRCFACDARRGDRRLAVTQHIDDR